MKNPTPFRSRDLKAGNRDHEHASLAALIRAQIVPVHTLAALVDAYGSAVRLVQLSEDDRLFLPPTAAHELVGAISDADVSRALTQVELWKRQDFRVLSVLDPEYPELLHDIFNRPPLLFIRGDSTSPVPRPPAIAVVGARAASDAGIQRARRVSRELVEAGFAVYSGLAKGIDTAAHRAALEVNGSTSAVMGTGLDRIFPPENEDLAQTIVEAGGLLFSQFFPEQPPARWTFPMRNVVMSGLALATVVVEASETSGARLQARVALQHGRTVFLLRSLVVQHEWAQKYVSAGAYGTKAIEISWTQDIVDRLRGSTLPAVSIAV